MNKENTRTYLGIWSLALALAPIIVISLLLVWLMIPAWLGHASAETGLGLLLALGVVIYFGSHILILTSLAGIGLATVAIYKTFWRRGLPGLLLNVVTLIIIGGYLFFLYYERAVDPDRLPIAAYHGDYKTVEKLLSKGFDVNRQCGNDTALSNASVRGNEQIVELLLSYGADVDKAASLSKAAQFGNGNVRIAKMLLNHGADPNCLHSAINGRHKDIFRLLLEHNADVNQRDGNGRTSLHFAVVFGDEEIIKMLINHGANVNAKNENGETPLHVLVQSWPQSWWSKDFRTNAINILIESKADIEAKTPKDKTPLIIAVEAPNSLDAIKILLEHRANINTKDKNGNSALFYAMQKKNAEILKLLVANGADENTIDGNGVSIRGYLNNN